MSTDDALLFIDANKYLDLYRMNQGKKLLSLLAEQVNYIFVTQQIVNEVQRNKLKVAVEFWSSKSKKLKLDPFNIPDHLSGTSATSSKGVLQQMKDVEQTIKKLNHEIDAFTLGVIEQISFSEDEVSKALAPIFAKAVPHTPEELQRARERRELGNPPGKNANPIGDQLTWEQILARFNGKKRLWIISRDSDYGSFYGGKGFLNRFLYEELCGLTSDPEVYLFEEAVDGITHFVAATGAEAEEHLTPEEIEEIEKEEKSLPHSIYLDHSDFFGHEMQRRIAGATDILRTIDFIQLSEGAQRKIAETANSLKAYVQRMDIDAVIETSRPSQDVKQSLLNMAKQQQEEKQRLIEAEQLIAEQAKNIGLQKHEPKYIEGLQKHTPKDIERKKEDSGK